MTPLKELLQQADQLKTSRHQDITITEDTIKEFHRTVLTGGGTTPADSYRTGMPAMIMDTSRRIRRTSRG